MLYQTVILTRVAVRALVEPC